MVTDRWREVWDGDGGDYTFTMSHVALSGRGATITYEPAVGGGMWVAAQEVGALRYQVRSRSLEGAILLLIAARLDLSIDGDFYDTPERDGP